ncbi:Isoaspartyl dipeptidase [uncultured Paludibacter sp.]|uniref:Isoaspartyl dipeptidase n=1 Tax=uncultured Paludibacter sp. TaxID=497635 RepID=A0A653AFU8_9BACT|nr:Isoaspartyl dipeptidase [uncultured Paludibacter sp.]
MQSNLIKLIKNAEVYTPDYIGKKDILIGGDKILAIDNSIETGKIPTQIINAKGKIITPGFIDQHIHLTGAGGKHSFSSMTPEISADELINCGTTTALGMLGTDGVTRSLESLYAKVCSLTEQGLTAYMLTGYFGYPSISLLKSTMDDMVFIDKVIGCKIAISDERASFPTENEMLKILRQVYVGGMTSGKGGILHVHLGALESGMTMLLDIVKKYNFPIRYISPTHVGRTKQLFEQAIDFAKKGGMIDISTGGTKYDLPYKQVIYAVENGVSLDNITFSSDGNAGMMKKDKATGIIQLYKAPIHLNLEQVILLIKEANWPLEKALKLITTNPARNLSLKNKGKINVGFDADLCMFDSEYNLTDVFAKGKIFMKDGELQN